MSADRQMSISGVFIDNQVYGLLRRHDPWALPEGGNMLNKCHVHVVVVRKLGSISPGTS